MRRTPFVHLPDFTEEEADENGKLLLNELRELYWKRRLAEVRDDEVAPLELFRALDREGQLAVMHMVLDCLVDTPEEDENLDALREKYQETFFPKPFDPDTLPEEDRDLWLQLLDDEEQPK